MSTWYYAWISYELQDYTDKEVFQKKLDSLDINWAEKPRPIEGIPYNYTAYVYNWEDLEKIAKDAKPDQLRYSEDNNGLFKGYKL